MTNKVKFSKFSLLTTALVLVVFVVGVVCLLDTPGELIAYCAIFCAVIGSGLYYCPRSVDVDEAAVIVRRLCSKAKVFLYEDIESVDTCYPSPGGIRLCGSGGFFGYWGYFSDIMIGTYFGYYGSRSHCFAIKLKSGRQYVIGCEHPDQIVAFIQQRLNA